MPIDYVTSPDVYLEAKENSMVQIYEKLCIYIYILTKCIIN